MPKHKAAKARAKTAARRAKGTAFQQKIRAKAAARRAAKPGAKPPGAIRRLGGRVLGAIKGGLAKRKALKKQRTAALKRLKVLDKERKAKAAKKK